MNTPELIYQTITFFFSTAWIYFGLLLLIITIRGDVSRALTGIKDFFGGVITRLRAKNEEEKQAREFAKRNLQKLSKEK